MICDDCKLRLYVRVFFSGDEYDDYDYGDNLHHFWAWHLDTATAFLKYPASPSQLIHLPQLKQLKKIRTILMGRIFSTSRPIRTISGVMESSHRALSIRHILSLIGAKFENRSG